MNYVQAYGISAIYIVVMSVLTTPARIKEFHALNNKMDFFQIQKIRGNTGPMTNEAAYAMYRLHKARDAGFALFGPIAFVNPTEEKWSFAIIGCAVTFLTVYVLLRLFLKTPEETESVEAS